LKNTENKYFTLEEYEKHISASQKNKDKHLIYLYATNLDEQFAYIEAAKERGYDVLLMDGMLDSHFVNTVEQKLKDSSFARVDSNSVDKIIVKDDNVLPSKLYEKQKEELKEKLNKNIDSKQFTVEFESLSETDAPFMITQNEFMRRMKDMSALGGGPMMGIGNLPDSYSLVVNENHPTIIALLEGDAEASDQKVKQLYDLARLSKNLLKGKELNDFVKRSLLNL
jgi:molecular chaperone HtpG